MNVLSIFYFSMGMLLCIWILYPVVLLALSRFIRQSGSYSGRKFLNESVSVIIAAHNEENNLKKRCENILSQTVDCDIEIIIASDGSTDNSCQAVEGIDGVKFIDIQPQVGRSGAHNIAVKQAKGDIIVFTDADTEFEEAFLRKVLLPFSDTWVGFVSGTLVFRNTDSHSVSESVGLYWKFEMFLRRLETELGIHVFGSGACCAVRKELYKEIPPTGDVDFITPLDVVLEDRKCVHVDAYAYDELPGSPKKEFNARVRMTAKNFSGTILRWGMMSVFRHPILSLVLFFHKIGRWFTSFFLIAVFVSNMFVIGLHEIFLLIFSLQIIFYLLGVLGYFNIRFLYSTQVYSFLLANVGFFVGIIRSVTGNIPRLYKPMNQV